MQQQPALDSYVCPHCYGRAGSCHACSGVGRLFSYATFEQAMGRAWAKLGCQCSACRRAPRPVFASGQMR